MYKVSVNSFNQYQKDLKQANHAPQTEKYLQGYHRIHSPTIGAAKYDDLPDFMEAIINWNNCMYMSVKTISEILKLTRIEKLVGFQKPTEHWLPIIKYR